MVKYVCIGSGSQHTSEGVEGCLDKELRVNYASDVTMT